MTSQQRWNRKHNEIVKACRRRWEYKNLKHVEAYNRRYFRNHK